MAPFLFILRELILFERGERCHLSYQNDMLAISARSDQLADRVLSATHMAKRQIAWTSFQG